MNRLSCSCPVSYTHLDVYKRQVKSYVKEQEETDKFKKASRRIYKMFMRAIRVVIMSNPAMMLSMYASFLMISWFGAHLIVGGSLTTGELTSMFSYTCLLYTSRCV